MHHFFLPLSLSLESSKRVQQHTVCLFEASASLAKMAETSGTMSVIEETPEEKLTITEKITKVSDAVSILSRLLRACQRNVTQSHA
jgi:hypothetical protein